jgi:tRNA (guanine-N7-)-methyltransferase
MRPKDIKYPFTWDERRPLIHEGVLFVPEYYTRHREWTMPSLSDIFGNQNPVQIEFCSGNGTWITEKAKSHPDLNWIAVEWRFERARKIWSKSKNDNLNNLLVVCGEAFTFAKEYLTAASIERAYINFPDPWPKEKHAKNRLFQKPFQEELSRLVTKEVVTVTDDTAYASQISSVMLATPAFRLFNELSEWPDYGYSYFADLWKAKGKSFHYFIFERAP